jgi:SprT-like protein
MTNEELTYYVQKVSIEAFSRPFLHLARWNSRLRTTGGRFFPKDGHLDFNPKMAADKGFEKIVLHELCHYHLFYQHKGYKHRDADFKRLLSAVGGARYAPAVEKRLPKYLYRCASCGMHYPRQRQIDTKKFRCGRCRGKLVHLEMTEEKV